MTDWAVFPSVVGPGDFPSVWRSHRLSRAVNDFAGHPVTVANVYRSMPPLIHTAELFGPDDQIMVAVAWRASSVGVGDAVHPHPNPDHAALDPAVRSLQYLDLACGGQDVELRAGDALGLAPATLRWTLSVDLVWIGYAEA